jgi:hypothetical protein
MLIAPVKQLFRKGSFNSTDIILAIMAITVGVVITTTISSLNRQAQHIGSFKSMAQEGRMPYSKQSEYIQEMSVLTDEEKNVSVQLLDATGNKGHAHEVFVFLSYYGFENITVQKESGKQNVRTEIQVNNEYREVADVLRDILRPVYPDTLIKRNVLSESDEHDIVIVLGQGL